MNPAPVPSGHGSWWGEGDEKIWVDGESFPSIFGTGTEDYFGGAWGFTGDDPNDARPCPYSGPFLGYPQALIEPADKGKAGRKADHLHAVFAARMQSHDLVRRESRTLTQVIEIGACLAAVDDGDLDEFVPVFNRFDPFSLLPVPQPATIAP